MTHQFHTQNREALAAKLPAGSLTLVYSGKPPLKTGDEYWTCSTTRSVVSQVLQFLALWVVKLRFQVEVVRNLKVIEQLYSLFFAERNFVYLTGIEEQSLVLLFQKEESGECTETLFLQQPDKLKERWNGTRIKADEASELSGIRNIKLRSEFDGVFKKLADSGRYRKLCLDLEKYTNDRPDDEAYKTAKFARKVFPWLGINSIRPVMKSLRLIKKPCEIEAMRRAETVTRNGIIAMMRASKPGLYEYRYKAEWDYALAQDGVLYSGYPPIISAGKNNFCIHYYAYKGQAVDGDMILNDVGAVWDNEIVDVSRGWPCNGRFNDKQKLLYTCAYNTSNYMFGVIKPGMPMNEVDATARRYNFEQLRDAGVCKNFDDAGRYIWHGGAHHIGYDVHDVVSTIDEPEMPIRPGMTFCVDVGIYHEEWGIGFRLEDNCLVTETGCENLSAAIPRGIDEIEAVMK